MLADGSISQVESLQTRKMFEMGQAAVTDSCAGHIERFKLCHGSKIREALVGDAV